MAAIITNKFRINNAEQFYESFSEASAETYYLFIGRAHAWASDADVQGNTIAEGTDASPPTPNDDVTSEFYNYDDMLGAKLIASTDVSYVIPRRNWTTGTTYDMYEHNIGSGNTANSGATNLWDSTFVVMNSSYAVYKCIENDGATASTTEPTSTSNSIFETADGYRWKYMYSLTSAETLNFMSTDFIHCSTDSTVSTAAVDGALDTILVVAGGSSYSLSTGSTITAIPIRGDGSSGICSVTISSGAISAATITTAGTGYTYAYIRNADIIAGTNAGGAGSGANLNVIIPPKNGHGYNALKELGAFYVMINKSLVGAEGTSDIGVGNDFRRIGLVRNPTNYGTTTVASATTRRQIYAAVFSSVSGTFTADEEINQASTGAVGKVVEYDSTNKILYWYQTRFPDVGTDSNGNLTAFSGANAITGQSSSASATPDTSDSDTTNAVVFASGYSTPELVADSGDILYVEERSPITRASDQTENIKLIIEF
ncbi:MAG: hypothetical protein H8D84_01060 [Proteobacteria bacterium]|nr:hypothetical protein [Pseudomonadota bacterium]